MKPLLLRTALGVLWCAAAGAALFRFQDYQSRSGSAGIAPLKWPVTSELSHETNRSTLLLFAHPACPCTRATVEELNRLLARSRGAVVSHAFLLSPVPRPLEWSESGTRSALEMIPGVTVHDDVNGVQARRFGAHTSGHVLLYDRAGNLMFSGGITAARGHIGDNRGSAAVLGSLDGAVAGIETPVFGCALESNPPARREEMGAR